MTVLIDILFQVRLNSVSFMDTHRKLFETSRANQCRSQWLVWAHHLSTLFTKMMQYDTHKKATLVSQRFLFFVLELN